METRNKRKFAYNPKPRNGMELLTFKREADLNKNNHPASFTQYEWNKKFNISKLKNSWKQKAETDFQINEQKFPFNIMTKEVFEAKQFVSDLIENDVLEIKKKRWNVSSQISNKEKRDHKKRLYELNHGLVSFTSTPKKSKKPKSQNMTSEEFKSNIDNKPRWNIKATLDLDEKQQITNRIKKSARQNTRAYWKEHSESSPRIGNAYISPYDEYTKDLQLLKKIKEDTQFKRDEVEKEVRYLNPGALNYPEKINAIVYKEMKGVYDDKLNKIKTNQIDKETNHNQRMQICDTEIAEKIVAVKQWKEHNRNKYNLFQTETDIQDYLVPLVTHSDIIRNKENAIEKKRQKDNEIEMKKSKISSQALANYNNYYNNQSNQTYIIPKSRYPINEYLLEDSKKNINFFSETFPKRLTLEGNTNCNSDKTNKDKEKQNETNFLSVYKKLSSVAVENNKAKKEIYNQKYIDTEKHSGTYRIFQNEEEAKYYAWSCCMKEDKASKGCQKITERKNKWNFY